MTKLREAARDESCVRCGKHDGTVVLAHYTGVRRLNYGGGYGRKVNDLCGAHLCHACHQDMDVVSRSKSGKWLHSEEFLHYIMLTLIRLEQRGKLSID